MPGEEAWETREPGFQCRANPKFFKIFMLAKVEGRPKSPRFEVFPVLCSFLAKIFHSNEEAPIKPKFFDAFS